MRSLSLNATRLLLMGPRPLLSRKVTLPQLLILRSTSVTRALHDTASLRVIRPFLLADIGEGITEVQVIQWFVQPGARVEQFDKLCEVSSDKATVEITSRFDGIIKKLHYDADDMAIVGKPLVDIDIQSNISPEDTVLLDPSHDTSRASESVPEPEIDAERSSGAAGTSAQTVASYEPTSGRHASLATPAVRHLVKDLNVDITDVQGSGKDGRVLKEDVYRFATARSAPSLATPSLLSPSIMQDRTTEDKITALSPMQLGMFKTTTASLSIPHLLYSDSVNLSTLTTLRRSLNTTAPFAQSKLTLLPFLIKAVSIAFTLYPLINARLDTISNFPKPQIILRASHNIGIAVDTPQGLVVAAIRNAQNLSIIEISTEVKRLATLARDSKLTPVDLSGTTFTVSNIGSIGGLTVSPVIVEGQVAIVGVGKARIVPGFDAEGNLVKKEECILSWSADHRVVDGATVARCAEVVKGLLEQPGEMLVRMK